ncbi:hypothetical protein LINPERPRIM_LOCUS18834 [Linum perenne]
MMSVFFTSNNLTKKMDSMVYSSLGSCVMDKMSSLVTLCNSKHMRYMDYGRKCATTITPVEMTLEPLQFVHSSHTSWPTYVFR